MTYFLLTGATFGLAAALTPGPLATLVVAESLRGGWRAGVRVAVSPLITDAIIITTCLLLLAPLPSRAISAIGIAGGAYVVFMGWGTYRSAAKVAQLSQAPAAADLRRSLWKGITTNILNPHAFLFWLTTGGPLLRQAWAQQAVLGPAVFLVPFFTVLVGMKMLLALGVGAGSRFLSGSGYRIALAAAGTALAALGLWTIWQNAVTLL